MQIAKSFYLKSDVNWIARHLIGKVLVTNFNGQLTSGIIIETEAYCGFKDKACHAYPEKKTPRTQIFYEAGGLSYVYLCYGIHYLFNIITGPKDWPQAVLIRAVIPLDGITIQKSRRRGDQTSFKDIASGPGKLSQALGISKAHNGLSLCSRSGIWLEDFGYEFNLEATPRIGIDYAGEDAKLPWRYVARAESITSMIKV